MRSIWLGCLLALPLLHAHAFAQSAEAAERAPLWPPDCTRDMPRDGLVLLDGRVLGVAPSAATEALEIRLLRTADGAIVDGTLDSAEPAAALLRWRSHAPLHANTEYKIEARMRGAQEPALAGYFTTGDAFIAPLAFSGRPAVRLLARAPRPGSDGQPETMVVRIAMPHLTGGLAQRPVSLSVGWSETAEGEQAAGLRGRQEEAVLPGKTLGFELEAQLGERPQERCLEIVARDDLGQELALNPPLCVSLPARSGAEPPPEDDGLAADGFESDHSAATETEGEPPRFETRASQHLADDATAVSHEQAGAGGCALGGAQGEVGGVWLLVALLPFVRRQRVRFFPG
jgi:hypothetical protein